MSLSAGKVVVLLDRPLTDTQCEALGSMIPVESHVVAVALNEPALQGVLDDRWEVLSAKRFFDGDQLREEFLAFLNTWPTQPVVGGKSFNDLFDRVDGENPWWLGPGIERHPDKGVFLTLRSVWLAGRVLAECRPEQAILALSDGQAARAIQSQLGRKGVKAAVAPFGALAPSPFGGRLRWLVLSLLWLILIPWELLLRAICSRRQAGPGVRGQADEPIIVLTSAYPRHAAFADDGSMELTHWRALESSLAEAGELPPVRHLLHSMPGQLGKHHAVGRWKHTAWPALKGHDNILALQETRWPIGAYLKSLPRQIAALFRYFRLEGKAAFRQSFTFAGADVSGAYIPSLRRAIGRITGWEMTVGAIMSCYRRAGKVQAVLVYQEMYPTGMGDIAAARRMGIPAIGVQHGTLFPMHLVYTLPSGQIAGAPVPDWFATFGEYSREVVSQIGAFPADRAVLTGPSMFDHLVSDPPDSSAARETMALPADKTVFLLATQFYPWFPQVGKALFEAVAGRNDCIVCVKTHPRDVPLSVYEQLAAEAGATNVRFYDSHFDDLLAACDVLVSGSSTTVLEAILLGRGAICVNFSDEPDRYPYVADGGALAARDAAQVKQTVEEMLTGDADALAEGRRRFALRHAGPTAKGQGAQALASLVRDCIAPAEGGA
jgi:hypothetical protein